MLEELQKKLGSNFYLKLAEVNNKGENFPLNSSDFVQENTPISSRVYPPNSYPVNSEKFSIYPSAPSDDV